MYALSSAAPVWVQAGESFMEGATGFDRSWGSLPAGTHWYDMTVGTDMAGALATLNGATFGSYVNAGHGSTTVSQWTGGLLASNVLAYSPRACLFEIGANDATAGTSVQTFMAGYDTIIKTLLVNDIVPVILSVMTTDSIENVTTPASKSLIRQYNIALQSYCNARGLMFVDTRMMLGLFNNPDSRDTVMFGTDGYHPNAAGYKACQIAPHIQGY